MKVRSFKTAATEILRRAGVTVDGPEPWDIQVNDERFYSRVMLNGALGLGETWMDGLWDVERLDDLIARLLKARLNYTVRPWVVRLGELRMRLANLQTPERAVEVAEVHYNLNNAFYRAMLGETMAYSCGYWKNAASLDEAQRHKLELICRKLGLEPGMRVLDIGCGWGSFARYAAERHGVDVVGINISTEQIEFAQEYCKGLPVEIRWQDYRDLKGTFDRIVSVGMFEHVGHKNYRHFMEIARRSLRPDGLFLLHTIGHLTTGVNADPWMEKYIFPNSELPSLRQISRACEGHFVVEDVHNFGADYDPTLMAWFDNFNAAWPRFEAEFGQRFHRMWQYYLMACAAAFRVRQMQVWQLVLSPQGVVRGYRRPE